MEMYNKTLKKENILKKFFWSPAVRWEKKDSEIRIEIFSYKGFIQELFPKFYFITQKGIEIPMLVNEFSDVDKRSLLSFIEDLIYKKILVSTILTPGELFYPQNYLFKNEYSEKIKYNAEELEKFKDRQLNRSYGYKSNKKLVLENKEELPEYVTRRKSYRAFDTDSKISYEAFSILLSSFRQFRSGNDIKYYYASAGGLYPVDVYIYVKENRVNNIDKGLYYYNPVDNSVNLVTESCEITRDSHYFTNKPIFECSAASIFFIYNAEVTMPKYGGMGYCYSFIDVGIMVGTLTLVAEMNNIGVCSIGDMNFKKIENFFNLSETQVLIHSVEVGLKPL